MDLNDFFTYSRVLPVPDDLPISGDFLRDANFSCIQGIAPNLAPIWKGGASSTPTQQISQLAEQPTVDSCDSRPSPCNSYPFPPPPNPSPTPSLLTALVANPSPPSPKRLKATILSLAPQPSTRACNSLRSLGVPSPCLTTTRTHNSAIRPQRRGPRLRRRPRHSLRPTAPQRPYVASSSPTPPRLAPAARPSHGSLPARRPLPPYESMSVHCSPHDGPRAPPSTTSPNSRPTAHSAPNGHPRTRSRLRPSLLGRPPLLIGALTLRLRGQDRLPCTQRRPRCRLPAGQLPRR